MVPEEDLEKVQQQIKEAKKGNAILFASNREIRRLPLYLSAGEDVISIITGSPVGSPGRGIIVATNYRVLFIKDGWILRTDQDFPYETISSVELKTGLFFGTFTLYGKGDETAYSWVGRFKGQKFKKIVQELSMRAKNQPSHQQRNESTQTSTLPVVPNVPLDPAKQQIINQIRQLEQLRNDHIISNDEFEMKKLELLSRF